MAAKKILIVDDEYDVITIVQARLEGAGFEVVTAFDGLGAIDSAQMDKPDLILLDLMMPVMDGYETAKKLKENPDTTDIPIIIFTAAEKSKLREMPDFNLNYISKPFDFDHMVDMINKLTADEQEE